MEFDARILETQGDFSLVQWEGRRFPGITIQGDSLQVLIETLEESRSDFASGNIDDAAFAMSEVLAGLVAMRGSYEEMMSAIGRALPYVR